MEVKMQIDQRSFELAHQIATNELLRFMLMEICRNDDAVAFRNRLRRIEEGIVAELNGRPHFQGITHQQEAVIREAACGFVTRLMASIPAPAGRN